MRQSSKMQYTALLISLFAAIAVAAPTQPKGDNEGIAAIVPIASGTLDDTLNNAKILDDLHNNVNDDTILSGNEVDVLGGHGY
ncbi:hypothetical protein F5Y17DRAFT_441266 [Xylariaceae sp. FL0594]|nr:hypothetical protein F5Y17DRAFT_441266 [Xylariaceae sp. FL0594]